MHSRSMEASSPPSDKDTSSTTRPSPSNGSPAEGATQPAMPTNLPAVDQQGNQLMSVPCLDTSALMILQSSSNQGATSPNVSPFDAARLSLYSNTPLVALSPAMSHPSPPHLVAPGTPVATYTPTSCDWGPQYLQIASLQSMQAAGFLSPAGHPVSPVRSQHGDAIWPDVQQTPGLGGMPSSPLTLPIPANDKASHHKDPAPDERASSSESHTTRDGETLKMENGYPGLLGQPGEESPSGAHLTSAMDQYGRTWLQGSPYCFEVPPPAGDELNAFGAARTAADGGRMIDTVLHSKSLTEQLLREFPLDVAVDVLRTALSLLGRPARETSVDAQTISGEVLEAANGSLPSVKLVHPDEFKNPSTFLKIYGDPLCFTKNGPLPKKGRNGNWECGKCSNVNFPRRFRCNMCSCTRHEEGDRVVSDYARQVYERYLFIYKHQQLLSGGGGSSVAGAPSNKNVDAPAAYTRNGGAPSQSGRNLHPMHPANGYKSLRRNNNPRNNSRNYYNTQPLMQDHYLGPLGGGPRHDTFSAYSPYG